MVRYTAPAMGAWGQNSGGGIYRLPLGAQATNIASFPPIQDNAMGGLAVGPDGTFYGLSKDSVSSGGFAYKVTSGGGSGRQVVRHDAGYFHAQSHTVQTSAHSDSTDKLEVYVNHDFRHADMAGGQERNYL
jgi:hypothetical protein